MAASTRSTAGRSQRTVRRPSVSRQSGYYVEGNAARKLAEIPDRRRETVGNRRSVQTRRVRHKAPARRTEGTPARSAALSEQARRNQAKALNTNRGFVLFLTIAMVAVMGCCVNYIRLKSEYTAKMGTVAGLEAELAQIKEDNDAYYSQVTSNVDLARIKKIAIGRLGMKYPSDNQMASYTTSEGSGYVRQYQDIPE